MTTKERLEEIESELITCRGKIAVMKMYVKALNESNRKAEERMRELLSEMNKTTNEEKKNEGC